MVLSEPICQDWWNKAQYWRWAQLLTGFPWSHHHTINHHSVTISHSHSITVAPSHSHSITYHTSAYTCKVTYSCPNSTGRLLTPHLHTLTPHILTFTFSHPHSCIPHTIPHILMPSHLHPSHHHIFPHAHRLWTKTFSATRRIRRNCTPGL